jgi:putative serine protease PepD
MRSANSKVRALLIAAATLAGAVITLAVVTVTNGFGSANPVHSTTTIRATTPVNSTSASFPDARTLYSQTAAGTVDIVGTGTSTTSNGPFGLPQRSETTSSGSGFVVDAKGDIVTAAHVVNGTSSVTARLQDGTTRKASVLGKDNATDIAVLKIDPSGLDLHPLPLGSSAQLAIGDGVAAIGDPFGYARSFSTGIVSGVDRTIKAPSGFNVAHAIQTDAALNPGNSGGPLLDGNGDVIGIVDQIATDGSADQSSGVGFAVPIDLIKSELPTLEAGKTVEHAYLGIALSDATGGSDGALIADVVKGGPADAAGLKAGDLATAVDGTKLHGTSDLIAAIAARTPGDKITLTVKRGSSTRSLTATLGTQPSSSSRRR